MSRADPSPRPDAGTSLPTVAGILSRDDIRATVASIAQIQQPDGMIPWFPGGHADPWNHTEAAMGLTTCGYRAEAERAYDWLAGAQHRADRPGTGLDGSWYAYYRSGGIEDARRETNMCAYVAAGVWHHYTCTEDIGFLEEMWPVVSRAIDFVLRWQQVDGSIIWSIDDDGSPESYALLTGSSSIHHSLRCAVACAQALGDERPDWELAASNLAHAIAHKPDVFAPKDEFAMDWYYPVLSGALGEVASRARLADGWETFVMDGIGVRCVSNQPWVTAAETAECVIALDAAGMDDAAHDLLAKIQVLRCDDGSYWTGRVYPDDVSFPDNERTTYTAAAMILAAAALSHTGPASGLFRSEGIPLALDIAESDEVTVTDR